MSRLGRLCGKAEDSNRANSESNQNFTHGGFLPNDSCVPSLTATQSYTLFMTLVLAGRGLRLSVAIPPGVLGMGLPKPRPLAGHTDLVVAFLQPRVDNMPYIWCE